MLQPLPFHKIREETIKIRYSSRYWCEGDAYMDCLYCIISNTLSCSFRILPPHDMSFDPIFIVKFPFFFIEFVNKLANTLMTNESCTPDGTYMRQITETIIANNNTSLNNQNLHSVKTLFSEIYQSNNC